MKNLTNTKAKTLSYISKLAFLSLALSSSQAHASDPLVTVTGQIDAKFSIEVRPEDAVRVQEELRGLPHLPPVSVDINDLFVAGDEKVIQDAVDVITDMFVSGSKKLIDLRMIAYRRAALEGLIDQEGGKDEMDDSYSIKFATTYTSLLELFSQVNPALLKLIGMCKSELCVTQIANAQRALILLGDQLNDGANFRPGFGDKMVQNAIESSYATLVRSGSTQLITPTYAHWANASRHPTQGSSFISKAVQPSDQLKKLGLEQTKLPGRIYKTEMAWLKKYVAFKLKSIVSGVCFEEPAKRDLYYTHVFTCRSNEGDGWHAGVYGRIQGICQSRGEEYRFLIQTFGPGLMYAIQEWFVLSVVSPTLIPAIGTWGGAGAKVALLLGGHVSAGAGSGASVQATTGAILAGFGGAAGIEVFEIYDAKSVSESGGQIEQWSMVR